MPALEVIGAPQSNFVRTVRMACAEKSVPYTLNAVFPHSPEVDAIHPFGKIPAMRHGDVALAETKAICTYIDLAFDGPPLIPRDPVGAAKTEQWISMINTGFDLVFARQYLAAYFFSGLPDGAPDRARIDAAVPKIQEMFGILDRELAQRPYLAGAEFTLADGELGKLGCAILELTLPPAENLERDPFGGQTARQARRTEVTPEGRVFDREHREIGVIIHPQDRGVRPLAAPVLLHTHQRVVGHVLAGGENLPFPHHQPHLHGAVSPPIPRLVIIVNLAGDFDPDDGLFPLGRR